MPDTMIAYGRRGEHQLYPPDALRCEAALIFYAPSGWLATQGTCYLQTAIPRSARARE